MEGNLLIEIIDEIDREGMIYTSLPLEVIKKGRIYKLNINVREDYVDISYVYRHNKKTVPIQYNIKNRDPMSVECGTRDILNELNEGGYSDCCSKFMNFSNEIVKK